MLYRSIHELQDHDEIILVADQQLLIDDRQQRSVFTLSYLANQLAFERCVWVQAHQGKNTFVVEVDQVPDGLTPISFRAQLAAVSSEEYRMMSRALQLLTWIKQHRFCGQCGNTMNVSTTEIAVICQRCQLTQYPRISPCMMCLIVKGDECLLAHHHRQAEGMYSTLAGFVEAGESIEQTLHREVYEEVGLKVNNLRYFASQSWPFPHQLMVAYFADYESGEIQLEEQEIADAQWFRYDHLPTVPPPSTLSGQLIQAFVDTYR